MVLSPLSEIPSFGRLNVYMISLFIFMILQIPTALAPNYSTLMAMRFLAGFVCSPALSTGGATLADVYSPMSYPYVVAGWAAGAVAGPVAGPGERHLYAIGAGTLAASSFSQAITDG